MPAEAWAKTRGKENLTLGVGCKYGSKVLRLTIGGPKNEE
jgi:hypothetical protein